MNKTLIRWLFVILLILFLSFVKYTNLLYRGASLFLILLLTVSCVCVLGVVCFRDAVMAEGDEEEPAPESQALLEKVQKELKNNDTP